MPNEHRDEVDILHRGFPKLAEYTEAIGAMIAESELLIHSLIRKKRRH